jgi:hypothetical protein
MLTSKASAATSCSTASLPARRDHSDVLPRTGLPRDRWRSAGKTEHLLGGALCRDLTTRAEQGQVEGSPRRVVFRTVVLGADKHRRLSHLRDRECSGIDFGPWLIWRIE